MRPRLPGMGANGSAHAVRLIRHEGTLALIEWFESGEPRRSLVPKSEVAVTGDSAFCPHPEWGIPYGVKWSEWIELNQPTPQDLERELYRVGIWTPDDLQRNPQAAIGALMTVYGADLGALNQAAKSFRQQQKES